MVAQDASGNTQPQVSVLQGVVTPNTRPPTFLFLNFTAPVVDQNTGFFAMNMSVNTSVVAKVYYSIYRCGLCSPQAICMLGKTVTKHAKCHLRNMRYDCCD